MSKPFSRNQDSRCPPTTISILSAPRRRDAEATPLQNVRERCLRAAEAWEQMAARVERTGRMRAETEARKAALAELAELQVSE